MILYHGSRISSIEHLRPFSANHEKPYVYLTHSKVLAAIYACNPMNRPNGFFTYWWNKEGILCYDEYFANQLESIYSGKKGYVYTCEGILPQLDRMPWVYLSEKSISVSGCTVIPDIYKQLLQYEQEGQLIIRRYKDASPKQREIWENVVKQSLANTDITTSSGREYCDFIKAHFKNL